MGEQKIDVVINNFNSSLYIYEVAQEEGIHSETITIGTNELLSTNPRNIKPAMDKLFSGEWRKGEIPEMWDGRTAERIVERLGRMKS